MTQKLLLIIPNDPTDDFTSKFSYPAAALLPNYAIQKGWNVKVLGPPLEPIADRNNVESNLPPNWNPDLIIHYGHGMPSELKGSGKVIVLNCRGQPKNVPDSLKWAVVSTVSCFSALDLGECALKKNRIVRGKSKGGFLGYKGPMGANYGAYKDHFIRAANAANYALLEGKSFEEAGQIGYNQYTTELNDLHALNDLYVELFVAPMMWADRLFFTRLGEPTATATGTPPTP